MAISISGNGHNSNITLATIHEGNGSFRKDTATVHSQVKLMQEALTSQGYNTQGADGKFGDNTLSAVKAFQRAKGLTVDGYFGKNSLLALENDIGHHLDPTNCTSSGGNASVSQLITTYSDAHRGSADHITSSTYINNLDYYAALRTIRYKASGTSGVAPNYTAMCCASYPKISRGNRGGGGCTTEYNSYAATSALKGTISDLGGYGALIKGMEVFQGDATTKSHIGVYFGKFDFGSGLEHAVYQSTTDRSVLKAKYEDSNKQGPNLTQMNNKWKYWIWPKYVVR